MPTNVGDFLGGLVARAAFSGIEQAQNRELQDIQLRNRVELAERNNAMLQARQEGMAILQNELANPPLTNEQALIDLDRQRQAEQAFQSEQSALDALTQQRQASAGLTQERTRQLQQGVGVAPGPRKIATGDVNTIIENIDIGWFDIARKRHDKKFKEGLVGIEDPLTFQNFTRELTSKELDKRRDQIIDAQKKLRKTGIFFEGTEGAQPVTQDSTETQRPLWEQFNK
jgi:hypothetical protein